MLRFFVSDMRRHNINNGQFDDLFAFSQVSFLKTKFVNKNANNECTCRK